MDKGIWLKEPEEHDFPAAHDFLELIFTSEKAEDIVAKLEKAKTQIKKAKDILRASNLTLLPKENIHVEQNIKNVTKHKKQMSPILLVRGNEKLIIADGYHRLCASYYLSEDLEVPCRLV